MTMLKNLSVRDCIAILLTSSLIALTFVLALRSPDSDPFKILLGALISQGFTSAIGFYFNSSKGSEDKSTFIAETAAKQTDVIAASSAALATSAPVTTTTTIDPGPPPTATTTTKPAPAPAPPSPEHPEEGRPGEGP